MKKLNILLVHNFYGSEAPSGENIAFEAEKKLLEANGHHVEVFTRNSDDIRSMGIWGLIKGALITPWNPCINNAIKRKLKLFAANIVHIHNTFPLISPAIFDAIPHHIPRVMTVHNYRIYCPAGIPMRSGKVCSECLDKKSALPSIRYGCYRNSKLATVPLAISVELHRYIGTWTKKVDAFIALTNFQRQKLISSGLPDNKVWIKPNFYPGNPLVIPWENREDKVVFIGRLSTEKGVNALVKAWSLWFTENKRIPELVIVGAGPLLAELVTMASGLPIKFAGHLPESEVLELIAKSKLVVMPSEWWEGFPMVIREAYAHGTPVAASNIGSLGEIVKDLTTGVLFEPGKPDSIFCSIRKLWNDQALLKMLGTGARNHFEKKYSEALNYQQLIKIYNQAINLKNSDIN